MLLSKERQRGRKSGWERKAEIIYIYIYIFFLRNKKKTIDFWEEQHHVTLNFLYYYIAFRGEGYSVLHPP